MTETVSRCIVLPLMNATLHTTEGDLICRCVGEIRLLREPFAEGRIFLPPQKQNESMPRCILAIPEGIFAIRITTATGQWRSYVCEVGSEIYQALVAKHENAAWSTDD